jgi:hypothetical protein
MAATPAFGAPMDEPEDQHKANGSAANGTDAPQELIDINDPAFTSEDLSVNPDADAYAQPAPPPDGKYRVKLKLARKKVGGEEKDYIGAKWGQKNPQMVLVTGVEASIIDPSGKYDGIKAFDFNVSTFVGRDNATKVNSILSKLRKPDGKLWYTSGAKMPPSAWMQLLIQALAGEPEAGIETQWEYSCQACGEAAKKAGEAYPRSVVGMHKFPPEVDKAKLAAGQRYSPEMKCPLVPGHGYGRARISIGRFLSLDEVNKK